MNFRRISVSDVLGVLNNVDNIKPSQQKIIFNANSNFRFAVPNWYCKNRGGGGLKNKIGMPG